MTSTYENPLFSILIANYNDGKYLGEALESVILQTYKKWEIIYVDDCSSDGSIEIVEKYKGRGNIHIFSNEENMGCGYTKRKCVEHSHGDICGFLDADDVLENNAIEIMVKEHMAHSDASLIYSRYYSCDAQLNVNGISQHQCNIPEQTTFLEYHRGAISHFASFKKKYYLKTAGINKTYRAAEDLDLYFKLEEVGRIYFVDMPLYYYRQNTNNNVSLGANTFRASMWECISRSSACERRNLSPELIVFPIMSKLVQDISYSRMRQSSCYRLGRLILFPLIVLKNKLFMTK